jgi:hypothetical protein
VPDIFLPSAHHGFHGLFIELKYGSNKPKEHQAAFLDALTGQGYLAVVCWGWNEARQVVCEYLDMEDQWPK